MPAALPPEVWIVIFAYSAYADELAPIRISSVCRLWREIAQTSPRIWQVIRLDDEKRPLHASHILARQWIHNSEPLQFDVFMNVASFNFVLPLLSPILSSADRWHSLTVTGQLDENFVFDSISALNNLTVSILNEPDSPNSSPVPLPEGTLFPHKEEGHRHTMHLPLNHLPDTSSLMPLMFTNISITEESMSAHSQPITVLEFLRACPQLVIFSLSGWIHDDVHYMANATSVLLPELKRLSLTSTCTVKALLSHIRAPKLEELYLGHLNVDWTLPRDDEILEGESDDEFNDFSRSPSSDLATGVGLRALIKHSKPPIRILRMDFADMRTKDFGYMFDHLHTLEVFSIVASDMSDKVMRMLKPGGKNKDQIRLPRLRILEFDNCIRISGDSIVESLSERLAVTDQTEFTLSSLIISGCDQFTSSHSQSLRQHLGPRLIS